MRSVLCRTLALAAGALALAPASAFAAGPTVYVPIFQSKIGQYDMDATGGLTAKSTPFVATGSATDFMAITPDGRFAYAPSGSNAVFQFDVGADGVLHPKSPSSVPTQPPSRDRPSASS